MPRLVWSSLLAIALASPAAAQESDDRTGGLEQPEVVRPLTPIPAAIAIHYHFIQRANS